MAMMHGVILGIGALLLAVPVLLHLLMQPKPKLITFPAMRFVQQMQRTNQRSLQLRHWLLLALRCLLLLAVAAAFARPSTSSAAFGDWLGVGAGLVLAGLCGLLLAFALIGNKPANLPLAAVVGVILLIALLWTGYALIAATGKSRGNLLTDRQTPVAAAVIVDASPSMQYRFENATLLQKAQQEGRWIIEQLPRESRIAVIRNDGQSPFFSVDPGAARKRLNVMETSYAEQPLPETIESAIEFLKDTAEERKEIYVLSDLTAAGWLSSGQTLRQLLEDHQDISLYLIDVGVEEPNNLALDQLELQSSSVPAQGAVALTARVRAVGPGGSVVTRLVLEQPDPSRPVRRDGKTLLPEEFWSRASTVELSPNGEASVNLALQDNFEPGIHHGWLELEASDSLAVDNRLYFTVEVRPAWKVLVCHPDNVNPGNLVDALAIGEDESGALYDVKVIPQRELAQEFLDDYNAVFLLDPGPVSDPLWKILETWVAGGGGLGIFLGPNAGSGSQPDGSFQSEAAAAVLPGRAERLWRSRGEEATGDPIVLAPENLVHPVLKPFRPWETLGIWQPFPVYRHWELEAVSDPQVEIIARFNNGIAALLERRIGEGVVVCMTTPVTEPANRSIAGRQIWNDLFNSAGGEVWPAWLLVTSVSAWLSSGTRDRLNLVSGQTATLHNDRDSMPVEYRLFSPRDEEPVRVMASDNLLRYKFTDVPGTYRLKGQFEGPVLRGFSVNLPAAATDLQRLPAEQLDRILGEDRYQLANQREELQNQQGMTRMGQEFYPILALAMSLVLALELIMSNRFYKK